MGSDSEDDADDRPRGELIGKLRADGMVVAPDGEVVGRRQESGAIVDETSDASVRGARPRPPYISPISPLYLPYTSPISPLGGIGAP